MEKINITQTDIVNNKQSFVLKNINKGNGITIGNALRRTLLSSIPGGSIYAIKIEGVEHEFQPFEGIKEDIIHIILNLKKLSISIENSAVEVSNNEPIKLTISSKDEGIITAADINCPTGVTINNPELYIATITKKIDFNAEICVDKGIGFVPFTENQKRVQHGWIPTDSLYSPILHIEYNVTNYRSESDIVMDQLVITIATNGSISPSVALSYAANDLISMFEQIKSIENSDNIAISVNSKNSYEKTNSNNLDELDLDTNTKRKLARKNIKTKKDLIEKFDELDHSLQAKVKDIIDNEKNKESVEG